jgi:hypothetical protein
VKSAATSIDGASELSQGRSDSSSTRPTPARIPILYVILGVLLVISIVPMYFYSAQVEAINRDRLKTNEMLLAEYGDAVAGGRSLAARALFADDAG